MRQDGKDEFRVIYSNGDKSGSNGVVIITRGSNWSKSVCNTYE